jgi:hypothetical protein
VKWSRLPWLRALQEEAPVGVCPFCVTGALVLQINGLYEIHCGRCTGEYGRLYRRESRAALVRRGLTQDGKVPRPFGSVGVTKKQLLAREALK